MMKKGLKFFVLLAFFSLFSCTKGAYVDDNLFVGTWELKGRDIYNGMIVEIQAEGDKMKGFIRKKPTNKYGDFFLENDMLWITNIKRSSNYSFKITEKKIGAELFSLYGLAITVSYKVEFDGNDKFYLGEGSADPLNSKVYYQRISK